MNVYFDTEFTDLSSDAELISIGMTTDKGFHFYAEFTDFTDPSEFVKENVIPNMILNFDAIPDYYKSRIAIHTSHVNKKMKYVDPATGEKYILDDIHRKRLLSAEEFEEMEINTAKMENLLGGFKFKDTNSFLFYNNGDEVNISLDLNSYRDIFPNNTVIVLGPSGYITYILAEWLYFLNNTFKEKIQLVSDVCHYDMTLFCNLFGGAFEIPSCVNPVCYDICQDIWAFLEDDYDNLGDKMLASFDISREELVASINYDDEANKPHGIKHNSLYDAQVIQYIYKSFIGD